MRSTILVWTLLFEGSTYSYHAGEYESRQECRDTGSEIRSQYDELLKDRHGRPMHYGCWPTRKLLEELEDGNFYSTPSPRDK